MKSSIIFAGSSEFSAQVLKHLLEKSVLEIQCVITLPARPFGRGKKLKKNPVHEMAELLQLPLYVTSSLRTQEAKSHLQAIECHYLLVVAFGLIIPKWLLEYPEQSPLNIHASSLPRWRGASPIHKAIVHGDKETGVCLMKMTQGLDEGPVYLEKKAPIGPKMLFTELETNLLEISKELLDKFFDNQGDFKLTEQSGEASYADKLNKKDGLITSESTACETLRKYRAFESWPGIYFIDLKNQLPIKIIDIELEIYSIQGNTQITISKKDFFINFTDGAIKINKLQFPGKKPIAVSQCLHDMSHPIHSLALSE